MEKISIIKLQKSYTSRKGESKVVLHNLSLDVHEGELLVLLGESGCGKSTLIRVLAGLESFDFGEIYFDGMVADATSQKDKSMAFVTQNYALFPHKTVYENIAEPLKIMHYDKKEIIQKINEVASLLHIEMLLTRKPRELSGGQCQRVCIARAIVKDPNIIFFDEPLSALDVIYHEEILQGIRNIHFKTNSTCIYSTHNQLEAFRIADRICILHNRKVEQIGTYKEIIQHPNTLYTAKFLNSVFVLFLKVIIKKCFLNYKCCQFNIEKYKDILKHYEGKELTLALRNTNLSINNEGIEAKVVNSLDNLLILEVENQQFTLPIENDYNIGDKINLNISINDICLFDGEKNII